MSDVELSQYCDYCNSVSGCNYVNVQKREISLTHIESRPSKQGSEHYDFFVDCVDGGQIEAAISDLRVLSDNVVVLTRSVDAAVADTGILVVSLHSTHSSSLTYIRQFRNGLKSHFVCREGGTSVTLFSNVSSINATSAATAITSGSSLDLFSWTLCGRGVQLSEVV